MGKIFVFGGSFVEQREGTEKGLPKYSTDRNDKKRLKISVQDRHSRYESGSLNPYPKKLKIYISE